jgi:hypothetical protein
MAGDVAGSLLQKLVQLSVVLTPHLGHELEVLRPMLLWHLNLLRKFQRTSLGWQQHVTYYQRK